jgi:hypothetical protein
MKKLMIFLLVTVILSGCGIGIAGGATETATTQPTSYVATLLCQTCPNILDDIKIWLHPDATELAGSLPANTQVQIIDNSIYNEIIYYKIISKELSGWVSEVHIKK